MKRKRTYDKTIVALQGIVRTEQVFQKDLIFNARQSYILYKIPFYFFYKIYSTSGSEDLFFIPEIILFQLNVHLKLKL